MPSKKITVMAIVSFIVIITTASITPNKKYKNLKVLPQDISEKTMDSIMSAYSKALNVSCDFCHVKPKKDMFSLSSSSSTDTLDFALDNPMKDDARRMIRLTIDINKNYFRHHDSTTRVEYLNVVSCNTCHRGNPYPAKE